MGQPLSWFLYEMRNTWDLLWYNSPVFMTVALMILLLVGWFSLHRN